MLPILGAIGSFATSALSGFAKNAIGSLGNSLLGGLFGDDTSAKESLESSKELQEHQYLLNRLSRQTAFQDTRQSLESAGYNPLLAVGAQAQGISPSASLSVQSGKIEKLNTAMQLANMNATTGNINADTQLKKSQAENTSAQTSTELYKQEELWAKSQLERIQSLREEVGLSYDEQRQVKELERIEMEIIKGYQDMNSYSTLANASMVSAKASERSSKTQEAQVNRMLHLTSARAKFLEEHPNLAKKLELVDSVSGSVSNVTDSLGGIKSLFKKDDIKPYGKRHIKYDNKGRVLSHSDVLDLY